MLRKYSVAESLALLPESERRKILQSLTPAQAEAALYDWRVWARPNQLPPPGDWRYWLTLAGRGGGKTRTGAETVREWASKPLDAPIHLVAPTASAVRKVMIEGPSGLLSCYPPEDCPFYEPSRGQVTWKNGNVALTFSAEEPERLRGPQCGKFWADELAAWAPQTIQATWDNLMFGFRSGEDLRGVITTTPKPIKLVRDLLANPKTAVTRWSTYENRAFLAPDFFDDIVTKYEGTRLGRQELLAEVLDDMPGALWTRQIIDAARIPLHEVRWDLVVRTVVAVDPAVTSGPESSETGIVVAALVRSGHVLVLSDLSLRDTPATWARVAVNAYHSRHADRIVGEVNNGGDLVEGNIRAADANVAYRAVRASRGKIRRAEPVAALYEQGRVHHVMQDQLHGSDFGLLEDQMCTYNPETVANQASPDRMDALVWAITELVIDPEPAAMTVQFNQPGEYRISPI
jgi:phage terminase large subunit-like protein